MVHGLAETTSGLSIPTEPFINISVDESDAEVIVNAIKLSLSGDVLGEVPLPENWAEFNKGLLKKSGLKSLKELEGPKTKLISVTKNGGKLLFLPTRPAKRPDKGYLFLDDDECVEVSETGSIKDILSAYELALSKRE